MTNSITSFTTLETVIFLLIDFVILASVVAGIFFLVLYLKSRKYKKIKSVNLNELDAFKNKDLKMETDISLYNNRPVAPSTISPNVTFDSDFIPPRLDNPQTVPVRNSSNNINGDNASSLFRCQMEQNANFMNDNFNNSQATNYLNM